MTDTFIGRSLGKYEVESKLGQGGMGMVYRGRQKSLNRSVAIKVLPAQMAMDTDFVERFRQEAQVIAGLQHENIVHVYDIDHTEAASGEPIYFIVMEFVDGLNLRQRPDRDQPMSWQRVRAVGLPVARALDYAHRRGIVHRDIKPANVMETKDGKIKLMDFGIAKSAGGVKTATGSVLGTPEYMAPEQAQTGQVTPRSDIYSLGVLLYELVTGRLPFQAGEPFAVALKHISEAPEPPSRHAPGVPSWLERLILRAMEKNPDDRFPDAAAMAHALDRAGADPSSSPSQAQTERPGPAVLPSDLAPTIATPPSGLGSDSGSGVGSVGIQGGFDPSAPTLETPAAGGAAPNGAAPTLPAAGPSTPPPAPVTSPPVTLPPVTPQHAAPPPPPVDPGTGPYSGSQTGPQTGPQMDPRTGPATASKRPVAWWPVAAVVAVLALVAVGYFVLAPGAGPPGKGGSAATSAHETGPGTGAESDLEVAERLLASGDLQSARRRLDGHLARHPDGAEAKDLDRRLSHAEDSLAQALAAGDLLGEIDGTPSEFDEPLPEAGSEVQAAESNTDDSTASPERPPRANGSESEAEGSGARPAQPQAPPPPEPPKAAPSAPTPLPELIRRARRHRQNDEYHSLRQVIRQIEARPRPGRRDEDLEAWARKVDGWIEDREDDLREEVRDLLDEFVDAVEEEDLDDMADVWGDTLDSRTAEFFRQWWQTYRKSKAEVEVRSIEPWDHEAGFVAVVRLYGKKERRDDMALVRTVTWRGRILDQGGKRMIVPFPG